MTAQNGDNIAEWGLQDGVAGNDVLTIGNVTGPLTGDGHARRARETGMPDDRNDNRNDHTEGRLARLKREQRNRSGTESALKQLLASGDRTADDKLATVKAVQKVDQRRVLSAVRHLLDDDGGK